MKIMYVNFPLIHLQATITAYNKLSKNWGFCHQLCLKFYCHRNCDLEVKISRHTFHFLIPEFSENKSDIQKTMGNMVELTFHVLLFKFTLKIISITSLTKMIIFFENPENFRSETVRSHFFQAFLEPFNWIRKFRSKF